MKLPSIIAEAGGSHPRAKQLNSAAGDGGESGNGRTGFDDILSDLHVKATGSAPGTAPSAASKTGRDAARARPFASAKSAQDICDRDVARGAPNVFDAPTDAPSGPTKGRFDGASGAAASDDGETVDKLLKRVGSGDDAMPEPSAPAAPQNPVLALVAPAAGSQIMLSPVSPEPEPTLQVDGPLEAPGKIAAPTTQPAANAAKPPLIFDVSVASQLAPTTPGPKTVTAGAPPDASAADADRVPGSSDRSLGPDAPAGPPPAAPVPPSQAETNLESVGAAVIARAGNPVAGRAPVETKTPSSSSLARPSSGATPSTVVASAAAPPQAEAQGDDHAAWSQLGKPPEEGLEADAAAPRKDEASSSGVTNAATVDTPATALSPLSPPVRQVAVALTRLAAETPAPSSAAQVPDAATPRTTVARTLTLQISPAALGTVAIRMHATGGTLDLQLTASDPRTAGLLARERDALAAALQDGHTTLHSLVIQDGSGGPQPGGHHATQGDTSGGEAQAHRRGGDPGFDGDRRQRREQPDSQPRREDASDGDRRGPQAQRGGAGRALLV